MGAAWPGRSRRAAGPWAAWLSLALAGTPPAGAAAAYQTMLEPGVSCARLGLQDTLDEALCTAFAEDALGLDIGSENQYTAGFSEGAYGCMYMVQGSPTVVFSTHGNKSYESPGARSICIGSTTSTSATTFTKTTSTSSTSTVYSPSTTVMSTARNPRSTPPPTAPAFTTARMRTASAGMSATSTATLSTTSAAAAHQGGRAGTPRLGGPDTGSPSLLAGVLVGSVASTALFLCACYLRSKAAVLPR